jgi:hypothetical protein
MFGKITSIFSRLFSLGVFGNSTNPFQQVRKLTWAQLAAYHATITPEETTACGITNGMDPHETAYRVAQYRVGVKPSGGYVAKILPILEHEKR